MKLIKNPDELIGKRWDEISYHCYDFVSECLEMPALSGIAVTMAKDNISEHKPFYRELLEPKDFCLVLMGDRHIGIYKDGGVYHADRDCVKYESIRNIRRKYQIIEYYDRVSE